MALSLHPLLHVQLAGALFCFILTLHSFPSLPVSLQVQVLWVAPNFQSGIQQTTSTRGSRRFAALLVEGENASAYVGDTICSWLFPSGSFAVLVSSR